MWIRLLTASFVFTVCLVAHGVYSQDHRLAEHVQNVAIVLDSSALSRCAPFDLHNKVDPNFKVLGIGEQTHGTSEFFKARISLIKSLATSSKLTKIGLEAPFAEVENLNAYITQSKGDLRQILKSFRLFNYECKEFVDLVENAKALNRSAKSQLTFFGIDMQTPFQALHNLSEFCGTNHKATADSIKKLTEYYQLLDNEMYNHSFGKEDFAELVSLSDQIFGNLSGDRTARLEKSPIYKSIKNYKQFLLLNNPGNSYQAQATLRDSLMAVNVIEELAPGDKIVILAHNGHESYLRPDLSEFLFAGKDITL